MISRWIEKFLKVYISAFLVLAVAAVCYFVLNDGTMGAAGKTGLFLAALVISAGLAFISVSLFNKNKYTFYIFIILLSALSCALWNLFADTQPVSDYKVLVNAGIRMAQGNFSDAFNKDNYFYFYNFQIGYVMYLGLIFKLFGTGLTALKVLDAAYISLSALLVFAITSKLSGKAEACIAAVLYAGFIPVIMGSSVINNQHLSTFLMLLGIFLVIRNKLASIGAGALCIALMNIIRPVGIVLLIAVMLYFIYKAICEHKIIPSARNVAVFLAVFSVVTWGVDMAAVNAKLAPSPISSPNLPYFKLVLGMCDKFGSIYGNVTENASKTAVYFDLQQNDFDYDSYNKKSLEYLKNELSVTGKTAGFVYKKMRIFLGERDNQYRFALAPVKAENPYVNPLALLGHLQYLILLLLALCSALLQLKRKDNRWVFILIALAGFFSVYVLVEAQPRYRYEAYLMIIMLAAYTLGGLYSKLSRDSKVLGVH